MLRTPFFRSFSQPSVRQLRRESVALGALALFLNAQCILPLSVVNAQTIPAKPAKRTPIRLAQAGGDPPRLVEATKNRAGSSIHGRVGLERLDLRKVPTEEQLRAAGGLGGELTPLGNADVEKFKGILSKEMGLGGTAVLDNNTELPPNAAGQVLGQARNRVQRLKNINLSFGRFVQERTEAHFGRARELAKDHLEKYPDSPWAGEAMLHLGMDAQYNGRPGEARARYQALLEATSNDPADPSYEMHRKVAASWADLDLLLGQWGQAQQSLKEIASEDTSPMRRTWAVAWLSRIGWYRVNNKQLVACGSEALGFMLARLGHDEAARKIEHLPAPRAAGFNLEELARLSKRNGVPLRGFRMVSDQAHARQVVRDLSALPVPFLVHYDIKRASTAKYTVNAQRIASWGQGQAGSCCEPVKGNAAASQLICHPVPALTGGKPAKAPQRLVRRQANLGHFLVVTKVDAAKGTVGLHDPQNGAPITLNAQQFTREWSGNGLVVAKAPVPVRLAVLSKAEMTRLHGGCCCLPRIPDGGGGDPNDQPGGGGNPNCPQGSPQWSVNRLTMNLYVQDIPIWYKNSNGPDVDIALHYNSQDAEYRGPAFGNKWHLSIMTSIVEMPNGWAYVNRPGGGVDIFLPQAGGLYTSRDVDVHDTLVKVTGYSHRFELTTPTGEKTIYDTPSGINVPYPVMLEQRDRWGNKLTYGYELQTVNTNPLQQVISLKTITDQATPPRVTTFTYDNQAHCTRVTDPFGRHADFTYDGDGNMASCTDMAGNKFEYFYDQKPDGSPFVDWSGAPVKLSLLSKIKSNRGNTVFEHQVPYVSINPTDQAKVYAGLAAYHPNGLVERFNWNADSHNDGSPVNGVATAFGSYSARYKNSTGGETVMAVDHFFCDQVVDGAPMITGIKRYSNFIYYPNLDWEKNSRFLLSTEKMAYDPATGKLTAYTDGNGRTAQCIYNKMGMQVRTVDPKGQITQFNYASNGIDLISAVDNSNRVLFSAVYDDLHQVQSIHQDPNGLNLTTSFEYTPWGALANVTNAKAESSTFNYDSGTHQLLNIIHSSATQAAVQLGSFTYDFFGRPRTITDADGQIVTYSYNDLDKPVKVSYPDGTSQTTDYFCCSLPGMTTDRSGRKIYYDYDENFRLRRVQDTQGHTLQMEYDPLGALVQLVDSKGSVTRWDYDALGQNVRKVYADGSGDSYSYDMGGNLVAIKDTRGYMTQYEYDANDNLIKVDYPNVHIGSDTSFTYDSLDRLVTMVDVSGTTTWSYDGAGRVQSEDGPFVNDTVSQTYDELNRRATFSINGGHTSTYAYDFLGRLDALVAPTGNWNWSYADNTGLPSQVVSGNGTRAIYSYDSFKRLSTINNLKSDATTILSSFGYSFDDTNKKDVRWRLTRQTRDTAQTLGGQQTITYGYDNTDQLLGEVSDETDPLVKLTRTFDSMGNRLTETDQGRESASTGIRNTSQTYTYNRLNQLTATNAVYVDNSTSSTALTYDANGNMVKLINSVGTAYSEYFYDEESRLYQILVKRSSDNLNLSRSLFVYDGMNRCRRVTEQNWDNIGGIWKNTKQTDFVYDGVDVVRESELAWATPGDNGTISSVTYLLTRVGNIGNILSRTKVVTGQANRHSYYAYDGSGNVTTVTDANQDVKCAYNYSGFGTEKVQEVSGWEQPWRYSTKWCHSPSGLYNYGFRFYNPNLGRWINRDPIREAGGLNMYAFAGNSPTNFADDYGNMPFLIVLLAPMAGGLLMGGLTNVAFGAVLSRALGQCYSNEQIAKDFLMGVAFTGAVGMAGKTLQWFSHGTRLFKYQGKKFHDISGFLLGHRIWVTRVAKISKDAREIGGTRDIFRGVVDRSVRTDIMREVTSMFPHFNRAFSMNPWSWYKGFRGEFSGQLPGIRRTILTSSEGIGAAGMLRPVQMVRDFFSPPQNTTPCCK